MAGTALVTTGSASLTATAAQRLVDAFLAGRNERTRVAYAQDLEDFRGWTGAATVDAAAQLLLSRGHGGANELGLRYRAELLERGLAPATVNRRLAALRSVVALARTLGLVPWKLEVANVRSEGYRDTRGPGRSGYRSLLDELDRRLDDKARRDRAVVRLLYDMALRRGEVVALDVADVDLEGRRLAVLGKGKTERVQLTLPAPTAAALAEWLEVRGDEPGPLFTNFDRAGKGGRLTGRSVARIVAELGQAVDLEVRPHGLRHAAITDALDLTNGNARAVQRFSRHAKLDTLLRYDDNRRDLGGEVAQLVAAAAAV